MSSLMHLANELLLLIADHLDGFRDLNAFAQTNTGLNTVLNNVLYARDVKHHDGAAFALRWAAKEGIERTAQLSLAQGAKVDSIGVVTPPASCPSSSTIPGFRSSSWEMVERQFTPLQLAVVHRREKVACLLIVHGANTREGYPTPLSELTPLHMASAGGLVTTVGLLLDRGAGIAVRDHHLGQTALHDPVVMHGVSEGRKETKPPVQTAALPLINNAANATRKRRGCTPLQLMDECYELRTADSLKGLGRHAKPVRCSQSFARYLRGPPTSSDSEEASQAERTIRGLLGA